MDGMNVARGHKNIFRYESLAVNNLKYKIRNLKWVGIFGIALTFAFGAVAGAQQPAKLPRIGYLAGAADHRNPAVEAFREGLRELGYFEGKNIQVEFHYTERRTDAVSKLVAELIQFKPDVLVLAQGQTAIRAAKQATKTIPIVMLTTVDPWQPSWWIAWRIPAEISRGLLQWPEN